MSSVTVSFTEITGGATLGTATVLESFDCNEQANQSGGLTVGFYDTALFNTGLAEGIRSALATTGNVRAKVLVYGVEVFNATVARVTSRHRPALCTVQCDDLVSLYNGVGIDRLKSNNTTVQAAAAAMMVNTPGFPTWSLAGELAYTASVQSGDVPLQEDINAANVLPAFTQLAQTLGGRVGPAHASWYADSVSRTIFLGYTSTGSAGTLTDAEIDEISETVDVTGTASQFQAVGGPSLHGLPPGSQITGIFYVPGAGGVADAVWVITVYAGDTSGGVYYLTPDRVAHPLTASNIGVLAGFFDGVRSIMYIATKRGVLEAYIYADATFKVTGGGGPGGGAPADTPLLSEIDDVVVDGAQVFALAANNPQLNGILTYPFVFYPDATTPEPVLGLGYDYWKPLAIANAVAVTALNGTVYYATEQPVGRIYAWRNFNDPFLFDWTAKTIDKIDIPGNQKFAITKLVRTTGSVSGVWVITQGGAEGLYFIADGATVPKNCNASGSLPLVEVFNIVGGGPGNYNFLALTGDGIYGSTSSTPGTRMRWVPLSTAGGLENIPIKYAASSGDMMLATDGTNIYDSMSGGAYWRNWTTTPVDVDAALRVNGDSAAAPLTVQHLVDGEGEPVVHLVNTKAPFAPGAALRFLEAPNLAADANFSHETISKVLLDYVVTESSIANLPLDQVTISGTVFDDTSAALQAKPLKQLTVDFTGSCLDGEFPDAPYSDTKIVTQRHLYAQAGFVKYDITMADLPITQRFDFSPSDLQYDISRLSRK